MFRSASHTTTSATSVRRFSQRPRARRRSTFERALLSATVVACAGFAVLANAGVEIPDGAKVAFKSVHGKWMVAENAGAHPSIINVNRHIRDIWETFTLVRANNIEGNKYHLQTNAGTYIVPGAHPSMATTNNLHGVAKSRAKLTLTDLNGAPLSDGDPVAIQSSQNHLYFSAQPSGALEANRAHRGPWEVFTIALAAPTQTADACIRFYEHTNYQGKEWVWGCGRPHPNFLDWNDRISSIKMPAGHRVQIFEHSNYGGAYQVLAGNQPVLGSGFNDKMSSWRWINTGLQSEQLDDANLAKTFAPVLFFDKASEGYPMDAQLYFERCVHATCDSRAIQNNNLALVRQGKVPVYFDIAENGNGQARIMYWFFYGHQEKCNDSGVFDGGDHPGDWERIMVTTNEARTDIAAVTYFQHGGFYTRIASANRGLCLPADAEKGRCRNSGFQREGNHPKVFVGKIAHGSYHDDVEFFGNDVALTSCGYYSDFRNPNHATDRMDTRLNLVDLKTSNIPVVGAMRKTAEKPNPSFAWRHPAQNNGAIDTNPFASEKRPGFNMPACDGKAIVSNFVPGEDSGCYYSECLAGDEQQIWDCRKMCRAGYEDSPLICGKAGIDISFRTGGSRVVPNTSQGNSFVGGIADDVGDIADDGLGVADDIVKGTGDALDPSNLPEFSADVDAYSKSSYDYNYVIPATDAGLYRPRNMNNPTEEALPADARL